MPELLLGCGHSREKKLRLPGREEWDGLVTLDHYSECTPDVLHDLEELPYPFKTSSFDELHAYCVLEHCGRQGDWRFFFDQFTEFWRIAKPFATFHIVVPNFSSRWAWGDPSHTRILGAESFTFLAQKSYEQVDAGSPMSDFRWYYKADWEYLVKQPFSLDQDAYVLRALK